MVRTNNSVLTRKEKELIAIAAAVASNSLKSLRLHFLEATKQGCTLDEIEEAVEIARSIKQLPINDIYEIAINLLTDSRNKVLQDIKQE